jgi:prephenate dehydrogenase
MIQHTAIIGLGLIGGSFAFALQKHGLTQNIIGVDTNEAHQKQALALGIVHEVLPIEEALQKATLIVLAIPVNTIVQVLPSILDKLLPDATVLDMGSTKYNICNIIETHSNRKQFVATHPMWGTEFSGPQAALKDAFINRATVICNKHQSSEQALTFVEYIYNTIGMHIIYMDAHAHDLHTAYISHISHITSFALANTVLEKEKEEDAIFELASGGFESTVRLAKSNAQMWVPIFMQNRENVLDVLNEHIAQLRKFKSCLEKENEAYLFELIEKANLIKNVLDK